MPPRSWRVRIEDILEAIDNIEDYVVGLEYRTFRADRKTMDAVERNLRSSARRLPIFPMRYWLAGRKYRGAT